MAKLKDYNHSKHFVPVAIKEPALVLHPAQVYPALIAQPYGGPHAQPEGGAAGLAPEGVPKILC
jgi:hypothetical protein